MDMAYVDAASRSHAAVGSAQGPRVDEAAHQATRAHQAVEAAKRERDPVAELSAVRELIPDYAEIRARVVARLPNAPEAMRETVMAYLQNSPNDVTLPDADR